MIHEINKQFILRGHEVTVVTMAYDGLPASEIVDGVNVFRINSFRRLKHKSRVSEHLAFLYAGRKFLDGFVTMQRFDICFAHFLVPTGILARWLYKAHKIPYIITAHGSDIPGFSALACASIAGDVPCAEPSWGAQPPTELIGRNVRLRIHMVNTRLYAVYALAAPDDHA